MSKKEICLTGIKATGMAHLGNWVGAISPAIKLSETDKYQSYFFIADYHSLNSVFDKNLMTRYTLEIAAAWLALGLDPNKVVFYKQSSIPEIFELNYILSCYTTKGLMNRAHSYKAAIAKNQEEGRDEDHGINMGLYTYPILMAADILIMNTDIVPVGADQIQHIEMARDIAKDFNHVYSKGHQIKLPKAEVHPEKKLLVGLDGRKMSKSYNNHIPLFSSEKELKKLLNKITTDSLPPEAPKDPKTSLLFEFYETFASADEVSEMRKRFELGVGWGHVKEELFLVLSRSLKDPREKYEYYMNHPDVMQEYFLSGAEKARSRARVTLNQIKESIGIL